MFEPIDYDTGITYEKKGNVMEYLGEDLKQKASDVENEAESQVDDAASEAESQVDDAASEAESQVDDAASEAESQVDAAASDAESQVDAAASEAESQVDAAASDAESQVDAAASQVDDAEKEDIGSVDSKENLDTGSEYDSSDEENYKKLETDINSQDLLQKHPCSVEHSYPEIQAFLKVIRNEKGEIVDELHKTLPFVTKYEYARIIGVRTKELNEGAEPFVDVDHNIIDGYNIAIKELEEKKLPFIVKRPLPNGSCEYWKLSDLELIHF